jgi:O-antigen ligase
VLIQKQERLPTPSSLWLAKDRYDEQRMKRRRVLIGLSAAVFLTAGFLASFLWGSEVGEQLCFLGLTLPVLLQFFFGMASIRIATKTMAAALPYLAALLISSLFNIADESKDLVRDFVILVNMSYALFLASVLASWRDDELWRDVMRFTALLALPLFVYVAITHRHDEQWGRWTPFDVQPNWWGMMALGLAWSSLAWKNIAFRGIGLTVAIYYLFQTQARGAVVAFLPAFGLCSGYFIPLTRKVMLRCILMGVAGALAVVLISAFTSNDIVEKMATYFFEDVMKLHDTRRGFGSGMSGRTENYEKAWNAFFDSPLLGNGYADFDFVHNGFLITADESGIFGVFGLLYLFFAGLRGYWKTRHWPGVGYVLSYIITISTYPRTLNINMTGLLFMFVLMRGIALKHTQRRIAKQPPLLRDISFPPQGPLAQREG